MFSEARTINLFIPDWLSGWVLVIGFQCQTQINPRFYTRTCSKSGDLTGPLTCGAQGSSSTWVFRDNFPLTRNTWLSFPKYDFLIFCQIDGLWTILSCSNDPRFKKNVATNRMRDANASWNWSKWDGWHSAQDVDIEDQIRNAQFMYPDTPWRSISRAAVSCIQRCLVVSHETRYTVDQALADRWLEDKQTNTDLARLEEEARQHAECKSCRCQCHSSKCLWFAICNDIWHRVSHYFVTGWMSMVDIGDGSGRLCDRKNIFLKIASSLVNHFFVTICPWLLRAVHCPDSLTSSPSYFHFCHQIKPWEMENMTLRMRLSKWRNWPWPRPFRKTHLSRDPPPPE